MELVVLLVIAAAILFVPKTTHAAPFIKADFTNARLSPSENVVYLYTRLTNTGDQDARVAQFKFNYLRLFDANGNTIVDFSGLVTRNRLCYVRKGCHVDNIEWVIHIPNGVPDYRGAMSFAFDGRVEYETVR
ncbi:MAG: hypothetical protein IKE46_06795 [Selenomonadaceae bacterium]|nr:hypothetical protein [Selenomonadaceae bacterium]